MPHGASHRDLGPKRGGWRGAKHVVNADVDPDGAEAEALQEFARFLTGEERIRWTFNASLDPQRARIEALRHLVTERTE